MVKNIVLIGLSLFMVSAVFAQTKGYTKVNNEYFEYMIDDCGDTLILASLQDVSISSLRSFDNDDDYRRYRRYRQYATKV